MASTREETSQPRMLALTQVEAHVTRLTAVREGLRKFETDDGRAAECVRILEVAIDTLESDPFPTVPVEVPEVKDDDTPETVEQAQRRERAATTEAKGTVRQDGSVPEASSEVDPPAPNEGEGSVDPDYQAQQAQQAQQEEQEEPRTPTTGYGSDRGIV